MERVSVAGGHVDAQALGTGEPILFVHGSILADAFSPLFKERSLAGAFRLITYHREGFAGSTHQQTSLSIEQQAADALAVLRQL